MHPVPLAASVQSIEAKPRAPMAPPILSQVVVVPEISRHEAGSSSCASPVVAVSSAYDPSDLAVHLPVTCSEPVIGADVQSNPNGFKSMSPDSLRQEDVTVQVPTTLPPHGVMPVQDPPPPPLPELPPEPLVPPLFGVKFVKIVL